MKVYLNTNVYCRPFDDLTQPRILKEATASLKLFLLIPHKIIQVVSSEMVLAEISLIDADSKRDAVEFLVFNSSAECISIDSKVDDIASKIHIGCKIGDYADCLHLALGCISECEYFVTCDDELLNIASNIESFLKQQKFSLKIKNPIEVVEKLEVK